MAQKPKMYLKDDRNTGRLAIEIVTEMAVTVAVALFLANFLFFSTKHASKSMEPTIAQESVVFSNRLAYVFADPKRFDVVSFRRVGSEDERDVLVRRVVALPGETIRISRGKVYVNGTELDLGGRFSEIASDGIAETEIRLNAGEYFLLGDMAANSEDSRSSTIGTVSRKQIVGKAWVYMTNVTDIHFIR